MATWHAYGGLGAWRWGAEQIRVTVDRREGRIVPGRWAELIRDDGRLLHKREHCPYASDATSLAL